MMIRITLIAASVALALGTAAMASSLDPPKSEVQNGIPVLSGGISKEGREELTAAAKGHNLKLVFSTQQGAYLADVQVEIAPAEGATLVSTLADGPWLSTRLPAGEYRIQATSEGVTKEQTVKLTDKPRQLSFRW